MFGSPDTFDSNFVDDFVEVLKLDTIPSFTLERNEDFGNVVSFLVDSSWLSLFATIFFGKLLFDEFDPKTLFVPNDVLRAGFEIVLSK